MTGKEITMNINGIGGAGTPQNTAGMTAGKSGQTDPESKNLQQQIEKLQNDLKEISANQEMPADQKMKKRQEIQKQISELQIQLRQHQIEVKKEEREKKKEGSSFDDLLGTKEQEKKNGNLNIGISTDSMSAMISADVTVKQANTQGSTARKMEGRANVLETEIKLDRGRGGGNNAEYKEAELADIREAAQKATASQMESLTQAAKTLEEAAKSDQTDKRTDDREADENKETGEEKVSEQAEKNIANASGGETIEEQAAYAYHPVDVRL